MDKIQLLKLVQTIIDLKDKLKCPICFEVLKNTIELDCGHKYCKNCFENHKDFASEKVILCPVCRNKIHRRSSKYADKFADGLSKFVNNLCEEIEQKYSCGVEELQTKLCNNEKVTPKVEPILLRRNTSASDWTPNKSVQNMETNYEIFDSEADINKRDVFNWLNNSKNKFDLNFTQKTSLNGSILNARKRSKSLDVRGKKDKQIIKKHSSYSNCSENNEITENNKSPDPRKAMLTLEDQLLDQLDMEFQVNNKKTPKKKVNKSEKTSKTSKGWDSIKKVTKTLGKSSKIPKKLNISIQIAESSNGNNKKFNYKKSPKDKVQGKKNTTFTKDISNLITKDPNLNEKNLKDLKICLNKVNVNCKEKSRENQSENLEKVDLNCKQKKLECRSENLKKVDVNCKERSLENQTEKLEKVDINSKEKSLENRCGNLENVDEVICIDDDDIIEETCPMVKTYDLKKFEDYMLKNLETETVDLTKANSDNLFEQLTQKQPTGLIQSQEEIPDNLYLLQLLNKTLDQGNTEPKLYKDKNSPEQIFSVKTQPISPGESKNLPELLANLEQTITKCNGSLQYSNTVALKENLNNLKAIVGIMKNVIKKDEDGKKNLNKVDFATQTDEFWEKNCSKCKSNLDVCDKPTKNPSFSKNNTVNCSQFLNEFSFFSKESPINFYDKKNGISIKSKTKSPENQLENSKICEKLSFSEENLPKECEKDNFIDNLNKNVGNKSNKNISRKLNFDESPKKNGVISVKNNKRPSESESPETKRRCIRVLSNDDDIYSVEFETNPRLETQKSNTKTMEVAETDLEPQLNSTQPKDQTLENASVCLSTNNTQNQKKTINLSLKKIKSSNTDGSFDDSFDNIDFDHLDNVLKNVEKKKTTKSKINILDNQIVQRSKDDLVAVVSDDENDEDIIEMTPPKKNTSSKLIEILLHSTPSENLPSNNSDILYVETIPPPTAFVDTIDENDDDIFTGEEVIDQTPTKQQKPTLNTSLTPDLSQFKSSINLHNQSHPSSFTSANKKVLKLLGNSVISQKSPFENQKAKKIFTSTPRQSSMWNYLKTSQEVKNEQLTQDMGPKPCVACSRLGNEEIKTVIEMKNKGLATFSSTFNGNVTHMVVAVEGENRVKDHTMKFVSAVAAGLWVLTLDWVKECLKSNRIVPEEPYEVQDFNGKAGPKISRLTSKNMPLFKGFKFYCATPLVSTTQREVENVIKMLGGKVFQDPESLLSKDDDIALIIAEGRGTQDFQTFNGWVEKYKIATVDLEWLSKSVGQYKVLSVRPYMWCSDSKIFDCNYPFYLTENVDSEII